MVATGLAAVHRRLHENILFLTPRRSLVLVQCVVPTKFGLINTLYNVCVCVCLFVCVFVCLCVRACARARVCGV